MLTGSIISLCSPRNAKVAELVDALDSGSSGQHACGGSSPPFRTIVRVLWVGACLWGCGVPGAEALDELTAHLEASTKLLEANRGKPGEALRALAAYQQKHSEDLLELERRCHVLRQALSAAEKRDLAQRWKTRVGPVLKRLHALKAKIQPRAGP